MNARPITPNITLAGQPTAEELKELKSAGYVGVINLRNDGEPEQPLNTSDEGELVRTLGMDYLHRGVGGGPLSPDSVAAVCEFLERHAGEKVLVHCRSGGRVAAMLILQQARAHKWTASEAIARGKAMGLEVSGGLKTLVEQYLATNS